MQFTKQQKRAFAVLMTALALMLLIAVAMPVRANDALHPQVAAPQLNVPTPITTPSSLDALQITSNLIVGGNGTVAGDLVVTGVITTDGGYIGITPVATATAVTLHYGNTPAPAKVVCKSVTVLGAATVTAPGITTPQAVQQSLNADPGNTYWNSSHTNSSGVVTVKVWQNMLSGTVTPQAATTAVAMDVCIVGQ